MDTKSTNSKDIAPPVSKPRCLKQTRKMPIRELNNLDLHPTIFLEIWKEISVAEKAYPNLLSQTSPEDFHLLDIHAFQNLEFFHSACMYVHFMVGMFSSNKLVSYTVISVISGNCFEISHFRNV